MAEQPETLQVFIEGMGPRDVPVRQSANAEAFEIMTMGLRLWDPDTREATFVPPSRIVIITARWPKEVS